MLPKHQSIGFSAGTASASATHYASHVNGGDATKLSRPASAPSLRVISLQPTRGTSTMDPTPKRSPWVEDTVESLAPPERASAGLGYQRPAVRRERPTSAPIRAAQPATAPPQENVVRDGRAVIGLHRSPSRPGSASGGSRPALVSSSASCPSCACSAAPAAAACGTSSSAGTLRVSPVSTPQPGVGAGQRPGLWRRRAAPLS